MKRFALLAAALLLSGTAFAQPPVEVTADESVELSPGQTKVVSFDQPVVEIRVAAGDSIAKVRPMTDRTFVIEGTGSGQTLAIAYAPNGKEVHRFNIDVAGHLVKIYGQKLPIKGIGKPGMEYDAYLCTGSNCGRVNPDLSSNDPSAVIYTDTKTDKDGNSQSVTKEYR
ncbi:pilus assembly protein N-terminal domain-containing protein [Bradyrhizobium sp. USDA 4545]|uniref:pilus assembly protein N-terminal domain-containing protein n=1 Tax=Bradyrhizobium sp. USDA 4545 TaxID=2817705 RepID=UPI0020A5C7BF|nr:pilus assembly protein N-terminal domain-containing protein [Bradyrhizobium sp. USDA 4545]MCP1832847.1 hypothetical protein [Bradyrhizobium sp. USDA 4545]